ncbi:MAG: pantoate--beta-alanine ligase [Proteobacteria bacterium]|nr:pantoate--beta-alanine ligase [Pseudomonadota bacterium]
MQVIRSIKEMQAFSESARQQGKTIVLVPTMGFLHEGHATLMREGRKKGDVLVISIFVNPAQFGPGEDYEQYPRDWESDVKIAESAGVDCIFTPDAGEMYPDGFQTTVSLSQVTGNLCGIYRPTHFQGVATVVAKLFNCTKPHRALFGEKDFQQLVVIRRMVKDLNFDIQVSGVPTVREPDGLAMSSRNLYLNTEQRAAAVSLSRALLEAQKMFKAGERNAGVLMEAARKIIEGEHGTTIDYIKICDVETLEDIQRIAQPVVMALAVRIGKARLIDNIVLNG